MNRLHQKSTQIGDLKKNIANTRPVNKKESDPLGLSRDLIKKVEVRLINAAIVVAVSGASIAACAANM